MATSETKKHKAVVDSLTTILADTFVLYYKTHSSHWNVEGPSFKALHDLFMAQYTEIWDALDELAERLRALDAYAPVSIKALTSHATLKEFGQHRDAMQMVRDLADDNTELAKALAKAIELADDAGDAATADLLTGRQAVHEKAAWMLRATTK